MVVVKVIIFSDQDAQGFAHRLFLVFPGRNRLLINAIRCLSAFGWIRKNVVKKKIAADDEFIRPDFVVA